MGFIQLAKGRKSIFFWTQFAANAVHVCFVFVGARLFGLPGAGMAFLGLFVFQWFLIFFLAREVSGFAWSVKNRRLGLIFTPLIAVVFSAKYVVSPVAEIVIGAAITMLVTLFSLRTLRGFVSVHRIPRPVRKLIDLLCLSPSRLNS
jgi:PST family polysaccharide transporter